MTLTVDNGTQFTSSRFMETLARLGIAHRCAAYHHPEGNSYIERFHRSLKEEWIAEYRSFEEAGLDRALAERIKIWTNKCGRAELTFPVGQLNFCQ